MAPRYYPLERGFIVTDTFGWQNWRGATHWGVDYGWPGGSANKPVYAVQGGTVTMVGPADGFGRWVVLDHPTADGSGTTVYGHVIPEVTLGQRVEAGQRIARINPDRNTNGGVDPHCHLELHRYVWSTPQSGNRLNPQPWLAGALYPPRTSTPPVVAPPTTGGKPVSQFVCNYTTLTSADDGVRPMPPSLQVIHTNEPGNYKGWGASPGTVPGLLQYLANPANGGSYQVVVGRAGDTGRSNDDNYAPWAGGYQANRRGLHICQLGWSAQSRAEWLSYGAQLDATARILAHNSLLYGIPLVKLSAADIRAGRKGVCGHGDTSKAWGETDHTDPGNDYPFDVVLAKANAIVNGGGTTPTEDNDMTPEQDRMLVYVYNELTKKFPSRSKYAKKGELIDTWAGMDLNVDGRIHEMSVELPVTLAAIQTSIKDLTAAVAAIKEGK